jgi:hypothetical protein
MGFVSALGIKDDFLPTALLAGLGATGFAALSMTGGGVVTVCSVVVVAVMLNSPEI